MNKKTIIGLILTIFLLMNASSAGLFDALYDSNSGEKNNDTTLIVGYNPENAPFYYKDENGTVTGFEYDLAKEVCTRNNWTFKNQEIIDWESVETEVNSNEIDCIWGAFTIDGREDKYTTSDPYYENKDVVVVKSDSKINSLKDLKDKTVEIQEGSSGIASINNNTTLKNSLKSVVEVKDNNMALMDLESGVCDAVIMDIEIANYNIHSKYPDEKMLNQTLSSEKYGIGFKKGNEELRDSVQKTLNEMFKDGTVEKIAQNYSEYKIPENLIKP